MKCTVIKTCNQCPDHFRDIIFNKILNSKCVKNCYCKKLNKKISREDIFNIIVKKELFFPSWCPLPEAGVSE